MTSAIPPNQWFKYHLFDYQFKQINVIAVVMKTNDNDINEWYKLNGDCNDDVNGDLCTNVRTSGLLLVHCNLQSMSGKIFSSYLSTSINELSSEHTRQPGLSSFD